MPEKNLFSLSETANIVGLSLTTIRRWSASGKLPTVHFSKRTVRVSRNVIEDMLNNGLPAQYVRKVTP
jgi:excisionase family DNA binding protein